MVMFQTKTIPAVSMRIQEQAPVSDALHKSLPQFLS